LDFRKVPENFYFLTCFFLKLKYYRNTYYRFIVYAITDSLFMPFVQNDSVL